MVFTLWSKDVDTVEETMMESELIGRYELRSITRDGQIVVGIYNTLDEALAAKDYRMRSQDLPMVIYDAVTGEPILPMVRESNYE